MSHHHHAPPVRHSTLRALAERAAAHSDIQSAVITAIRGVLPSVLEQLIAEEAERQGSHVLRLYPRRAPVDQRHLRDQRLRALIQAGKPPDLAAMEVGCSRAHAYRVRKAMEGERRQSQPQP